MNLNLKAPNSALFFPCVGSSKSVLSHVCLFIFLCVLGSLLLQKSERLHEVGTGLRNKKHWWALSG